MPIDISKLFPRYELSYKVEQIIFSIYTETGHVTFFDPGNGSVVMHTLDAIDNKWRAVTWSEYVEVMTKWHEESNNELSIANHDRG